jgi:ketopantoate reductase
VSVTTAWTRAGFGLWRRERGAILRVREILNGVDLHGATGNVRAEVAHDGTTILRDFNDADSARAWCDRWAETLIREAP